jgi:hypothetical protein
MEKIKENALADFKKLIYQSWTYEKLTREEKNQLFKLFEDIRTTQALKGTYYQRWGILQAIYKAFLLGVGYDSFDWRS